MEHVVADLVAPGRLNDVAPDVGDFRSPLLLGDHQQLGLQQSHRFFLVLKLGALLGAAHRQTRGDVEDAHGGFHLVHVLSAGAAGSGCGDLQILFGDVDVDLLLQFRHHLHAGKAGLALVVRVERGDPHQAMGAFLVAQVAVGVAALDFDRGALDAGFLPFGEFIDADLHAVVLRPARVHAQQHLGPVLGVGAAGAGIDGEHDAFLVVFTAEQPLQLPAIEFAAELVESRLRFAEHLVVGLQVVELNGGFTVLHRPAPLHQLLELRLHLIEATHLLLRILLVIPEVGLGSELFEVLLSGFQCRNVKDSPGHGPGG